MRKSIAILFLSITFVGVTGYNFILAIVKEHHKEEMMEKIAKTIPEAELKRIFANSEDIRWLEEGKEFFYQHQLFDVVKTISENGKETLLCISDGKEKQLIEKQNSLTENNTTGTPEKNNKKAADSKSTDLFSFEVCPNTTDFSIFINSHFAILQDPALVSGSARLATPPPRG